MAQAHNSKTTQDPNAALMDMLKTVRALRNVVSKETEVLEQTDISAFMGLQDEKLEIARTYYDRMADLLNRKDQIKLAKPEIKAEIARSQKEFSDIVEKNREQLERMGRSTKRLGDRIMGAARREANKENQIIYGSSGRVQDRNKASIGVNESA